jgi:hypothetical protein
MSTGMRMTVSVGIVRGLALSAFFAFLTIALPARAAGLCGGPRQPPCPPPLPVCGGAGMPACPGTFLDTYFNVRGGDNTVSLINPVSSPTSVCAMIYMFDDVSELGECCGCPLSPQKLLTLSVVNNLTASWPLARPGDDQLGVIEILTTAPNNPSCASGGGLNNTCNGGCDPTQKGTPIAQLKGDIVHSLQTPGGPEVPFAAVNPDPVAAAYAVDECEDSSAEEVEFGPGGLGACNCQMGVYF